jgi:hypothetical protein
VKLTNKQIDALATTIGKLNGTFGRRLVTAHSNKYWSDPANMERTPTPKKMVEECGCADYKLCPNLNKCKRYKGTRWWRAEVRIALRDRFKKV